MAIAHILVCLNLSLGLPKSISINAWDMLHHHNIDYESITFKCSYCHAYKNPIRYCNWEKEKGRNGFERVSYHSYGLPSKTPSRYSGAPVWFFVNNSSMFM